MSYDELKLEIERAPMTWIPALLVTVVRRAVREPVFVDGGMQRCIDEAVRQERG